MPETTNHHQQEGQNAKRQQLKVRMPNANNSRSPEPKVPKQQTP
jgi:hypothetical protein